MSKPNFQTVKQFVAENPAFTDGGVRFQIFNEDKNGLKEAQAIIRMGRKVLIDADRYFDWIYNQNQSD